LLSNKLLRRRRLKRKINQILQLWRRSKRLHLIPLSDLILIPWALTIHLLICTRSLKEKELDKMKKNSQMYYIVEEVIQRLLSQSMLGKIDINQESQDSLTQSKLGTSGTNITRLIMMSITLLQRQYKVTNSTSSIRT
jgi:hypothetical protein